jgi:uncharacterized protein
VDYASLVRRILDEYPLSVRGIHGITHWARVWENGLRLAATNGADVEVVKLFALFHDSRRENDGTDPDHGRRGADLARRLRRELFDLPDAAFELLCVACEWHTDSVTHPDPTVQACWDADRLDLGRVGMMPTRKYLNTAAAHTPGMIDWAHKRSVRFHEPALVAEVWGVPESDW